MDLEKFDLAFAPRTTKKGKTKTASDALVILDGWFTSISRRARWLDVVGDYAGTEPFVVDGDALVQIILNDDLLALGRTNDPSFQLLHALQTLEWRISRFIHCNVNFDVVFFEDNRHLNIPTNQSSFVTASKGLARMAICRHLYMISQRDNAGFQVLSFSGLDDPSWREYESRKKPMFIMTNDGGHAAPDKEIDVTTILLQREFIREVLSRSTAVVLLDGAEYRSAKILSFVFEDRADTAYIRTAVSGQVQKARQALAANIPLPALWPNAGDAPAMERLLVPLGRTCIDRIHNEDRPLLYIVILQCFIFEDLALNELAQPPPSPLSDSTAKYLTSFLTTIFLAAAEVLVAPGLPLIFPFDGTLFVNTLWFTIRHCQLPLSDLYGCAVVDATNALWECISPEPCLLELTGLASRFPDLSSDPSGATRHHIQHQPLGSFVNSVFGLHPVPEDVQAAPGSSIKKKPQSEHEVLSDWEDDEDDEEDEDEDDSVSEERITPPSATLRPEFGFESTVFTDDKHWHNSKSLLPNHFGGSNRGAESSQLPVDVRQRSRVLRKSQRVMTQIQRQAASLTGAQGAVLTRIAIPPVGSKKHQPAKPKSPSKTLNIPHKGSKKAKQPQVSSKEKLLAEIASKKENDKARSQDIWWAERLKELANVPNHQRSDLILSLSRNAKTFDGYVGSEFVLYTIHSAFMSWVDSRERASPQTRDQYTVDILRKLKDLTERDSLTPTIAHIIVTALNTLGFAKYAEALQLSLVQDRPLGFQFIKLMSSKSNQPIHEYMRIDEDPISWQLRLFGPYMDRSMDGAFDGRVNFIPDAWQRKVLDSIDRNESLLVVAPTSAGKTFISFYAMEKVLRSSDTGVIVYICPTKALVMQVAAEIYARFSKDLNGSSFWAVHTRDYRINDPLKCQILITVPEMLSIMLLSPALSDVWSNKLERIILDEIHTIGQQEGGAVWEQILLLAPCPVIGLSATVGSPETFNVWLASVQKAHNFHHTFIQHPHRYSHLRKFVYTLGGDDPSPFQGLSTHTATKRDRFLHPIATLSFGARSLPADFTLEAADTLSLYHAMIKSDVPQRGSIDLNPGTFFKDIQTKLLTQGDVISYEAVLKSEIEKMLLTDDARDPDSGISKVILGVTDPALSSKNQTSKQKFLDNLLHLVCDLHVQNELPAILFNFDRTECDIIVQTLTKALESAERDWKNSSKEWQQKMAEWNEWKQQAKTRQRQDMKNAARRKDVNEEPRESPASTWHSHFQPNHPTPDFTFASAGSSMTELEEAIASLAWSSTPEWQKRALRRGIAVHHAGTNKSYRTMVETLFRTGALRVVVATGTLALGINAPTKTCVFVGDSPYLTALMYRQCSGRAGRRGFDLLGKVVFYGLPTDRIQRLVLSKLPSLSGNFPLTATLALRLFNLLENSNHSPFAVKSIKSILSLPHISFGSSIAEQQLRHHLRFSIEYLRRSGLLDETGRPMSLFGICAHLYHTEPSNFALVALMRAGILHQICANPILEDAKKDLILLLSHLFGRRYLLPSYTTKENLEVLRKSQPSQVVLPALPQGIRNELIKHGREILDIYSAYAVSYGSQNASALGSDNLLPLSQRRFAGSHTQTKFKDQLRKTAIKVSARSLFVATSGHDDRFGSIRELASTLRHGFEIHEHAIPSLDELTGVAVHHPLNAYILDFFVHGQVLPLVVANGIRRGDLWYLLQDFVLAMMTIRATMRQLFDRAAAEAKTADESILSDSIEDTETLVDDMDDGAEEEGDIDGYERPSGVSDMDWRVYEVLSAATVDFDAKFHKMWA